jgi:hypothetical protein
VRRHQRPFIILWELTSLTPIDGCDWRRVQHTDAVYGACAVAIIRALDKEGRLTTERIPNLETILRLVALWGDLLVGQCDSEVSEYAQVVKGLGQRLFKNKTNVDIKREKAMLEEWIRSLDKDEQAVIRERLAEDEDEEDSDEEDQPWYNNLGNADAGLKDKRLTLTNVWKPYRDYLLTCPGLPFGCPPTWDITEWPEDAKAKYLYSNWSN